MEARRRSRRRRGTDNDRRQGEEIVRLNDHGESTPALDMTATAPKRDRVDVTADHEAAP
jgi:hypothetical protein